MQNVRSRSHSASLICAGPSTLSSSSTDSTLLSSGIRLSSVRVRMTPSLTRLPLPKGTVTRTPLLALSSSAAGTR